MITFIRNMYNLIAVLMVKAESATQFDRALSLNEAKNYKEAFPLMKESAEAGDVRAMSILGGMYLLGRGTAENGKEAVRWLKQAVDSGYGEAAPVLAMGYATGKAGVKRNIPLARAMLRKAASEGDEKCREMLEAIDKRQGIFRNLK